MDYFELRMDYFELKMDYFELRMDYFELKMDCFEQPCGLVVPAHARRIMVSNPPRKIKLRVGAAGM